MTAPHLRFETLIERHHDEIFRYLWRMLYDSPHDPQDITQETFMRAYQTYHRLRPDSNYRAWLYKIATNCAYSVLRRSPREDHLDDFDLHDESQSPVQEVILQETLALAEKAINRLPLKQRSAVIMRHLEGCEYAEIAQALNCSEESARANVSQAVRRLRRELETESGEA